MKFQTEYRDAAILGRYSRLLARVSTRPWVIMEICGGQTHSIVRHGIDRILPRGLDLVHGPGCPVCVTPAETIDRACRLAKSGVILCSFGDMIRVPGNEYSLDQVKASGGDVRTVYSPLDALAIARANPDREVVFFAVGFETTAPANAMAVVQADADRISNFSLLVSHVLVPPAIEAILSAPENRVQGFLAAGHVCTIMGTQEYEPVSQKFKVPIVVAGFEPVDILQALVMCVRQLEGGRHDVENQYSRSVLRKGNEPARKMIADVFLTIDRDWRGMGTIHGSGLGLRERYARFDSNLRFPDRMESHALSAGPSVECISGRILTGNARPSDCASFGKACTPDRPLGAPMVSSEGACAAYYRYRGVGSIN